MDPPVYNPTVPYTGYINGGFRPGRHVRVQGKISHNAHSFSINLQCGPSSSHDDVALHVNPRFTENAVIRNSKNYSSWGNEERHGMSFPFVVGQSFEVMIMCEAQQFKVAINGQHFTEYNHRVPVERISSISIDGDITIALVQFEGSSAPGGGSYAPTAPAMASAPGGMPPPYPPAGSGGMPIGFMAPSGPHYPPSGPQTAGYPSNVPPAGYPPNVPPQGGYPSNVPPQGGYPSNVPPQGGYPSNVPPQGGYPSNVPPAGGLYAPAGGYPQQGYPQQGYPQQPGYAQQGYPQGQPASKGGGLLDSAGKMLAGGLAGVGLAKVANKIPGMGGHSQGFGGGHHGGQSGGGGMGKMGGILGSAAALGIGGAVAGKAMKGHKKKSKLLKYGVPLAGVGLGGYALKKGMKGFGGSSSSSSDSD